MNDSDIIDAALRKARGIAGDGAKVDCGNSTSASGGPIAADYSASASEGGAPSPRPDSPSLRDEKELPKGTSKGEESGAGVVVSGYHATTPVTASSRPPSSPVSGAPSLSPGVTPPPSPFRFRWSRTAPHAYWFPDEGFKAGPETVFSEGFRLKSGEKPYVHAKMYLMLRVWEDMERLACEMCGEELRVHPETGLAIADVHHEVDPQLHRADTLKLLCDTCNGKEGPRRTPPSDPKREKESAATAETKSSSTEFDISYNAMRPRWCRWLLSGKWNGGPGPLFDGERGKFLERKLDDLCANAPRALARATIGEEWLGVFKTYRYNYVPQDLDSAGGPLHVFQKINPETNHSETWVRLSDAMKERLRGMTAKAEEKRVET